MKIRSFDFTLNYSSSDLVLFFGVNLFPILLDRLRRSEVCRNIATAKLR